MTIEEAREEEFKEEFEKYMKNDQLGAALRLALAEGNKKWIKEAFDATNIRDMAAATSPDTESSPSVSAPSGESPQPSGASIVQIGDLLDDKFDPVLEVLPKDDQGAFMKVASVAYVDRMIDKALKSGTSAPASPITEKAKTKVASSVGASSPSTQTSSTPSVVTRIGEWLTEKKH